MKKSPFLEDPRTASNRHIAEAVASPLEQARAIHLDMAEHLSAVARDSRLPPLRDNASAKPPVPTIKDRIKRVLRLLKA